MSEPVVKAIIGGTALVAAVFLVRGLRQTREEWGYSSTFFLAFALIFDLPTLFAALAGNKYLVIDKFGTAALQGDENYAFTIAAKAVMCALALCLAARQIARDRNIYLSTGPLMLFLAALVAILANGWQGRAVADPDGLGILVVFGACCLIRGGRAVALGAAAYGLCAALLSAAITILRYEITMLLKCGPLGGLYYGAYNHENQFGMLMSLTIPFVYLAFNGHARIVLTSYLALLAWFTGSRTATISALIGLAVVRRGPDFLPCDHTV